MVLLKYLKSRGPLLALLVILLYGILIFTIYFTGYHAMPNHMDELPVTVVNQDSKSHQLAHQLKEALPFKHVKITGNLTTAKSNLNHHKTYLIVSIPKNFNHQVTHNQTAKLDFYVNDAVQSSVSASMKQIAQTMGDKVSQQVILKKGKAMLTQSQMAVLQKQLAAEKTAMQEKATMAQAQIAQAPAAAQGQMKQQLAQQTTAGEQKLSQTAKTKEKEIKQGVDHAYAPVSKSVKVNIHQENRVPKGLNYSLAPFIANLALTLSSLFGALMLYGTYAKFVPQIGRFKAFLFTEITMGLLALVGTAIVSGTMMWLLNVSGLSFLTLWLNHGLLLFSTYNLNIILILLIGQAGTALNVFITMIQVVASAGMIPVLTMAPFFKALHGVLPMFYGTTADFNIMYGGAGTQPLLLGQLGLIIGLIVINTVIVAFRKKQPMLQFSQLS